MLGFCWKRGLYGNTRVWFEAGNILVHSWNCHWNYGLRSAAKAWSFSIGHRVYLSIGLPFHFELAIRFKGNDSYGNWRGYGIQVLAVNFKKFASEVAEYLKTTKA